MIGIPNSWPNHDELSCIIGESDHLKITVKGAKMTEVIDKTPEEVQSWINSREACLIDVREDQEVAQARIPDTDIHIPLSRFDPSVVPTNSAKKLVFILPKGFAVCRLVNIC